MIKQPINSAEFDHYIKLIQDSSRQLMPLPVNLPDKWKALIPKKEEPVLNGIKAVLFDLYGTLFISAAGEISAGTTSEEMLIPVAPEAIPEMTGYFHSTVKQSHEKARSQGIAWPEVRVEELWAAYKGAVPPEWKPAQNMHGRELALRYELAINPVYPMPHVQEALRSLAAGGILLGIISNAQFYTPLLFNAFFNASPAELGFNTDLLIYSFEEKEAKPSPRLFNKARESLAKKNIRQEETLFVGNDMKNDITAAANAGFITALFAGDNRSLRLRENDPACAGVKPRFILNDLLTLLIPETVLKCQILE